ncbi:hypothetical protein LCGC14_0812980 [marine sediment metagenome]|uniref:Uncharacterized protein n=1 Tax=marine sediment metagenome TaxID=412755 RepID=A0A0F9STI0_9ZZZZ
MDKTALMVRNETIAQERIAGLSFSVIATKHHLSKSAIAHVLGKDHIKEAVQDGILSQIDLIPQANTVVEDCLKSDDEKIKLDASKVIFKNVGITPSHTQININAMFKSDNRTQNVQIQGLQEFMAFKYRDVGADKVIDVTPEGEGKLDE